MRLTMRVGDLLPGDPMFGIRLAGLSDAILPSRIRTPSLTRSSIIGPTGNLNEAAKAVIEQAQRDAGSGVDMSDVAKQSSMGAKVGVLALGVVGGLALMKLLASKKVF